MEVHMNVWKQYWKLAAVIVLLVGSFCSGWYVKTLKDGYEQNIVKEVKEEVRDALTDVKEQNYQNYLKTKEYLDSKQINVIREKIPVIIEKEREIYYQICMEEKGVEALRLMRENSRLARGMK